MLDARQSRQAGVQVVFLETLKTVVAFWLPKFLGTKIFQRSESATRKKKNVMRVARPGFARWRRGLGAGEHGTDRNHTYADVFLWGAPPPNRKSIKYAV